ncbi:hypothetical protein EIP91_005480 [Steccherinum ochraceum]|uniref:Uncharacterized protein n=1 Tax=Steccherinum ochraceum TaxID=92696 RepID=A0A4R0S450_9APHY|nr:hypothetical protein EIP91_005480 [Steccherinum ochraceum]
MSLREHIGKWREDEQRPRYVAILLLIFIATNGSFSSPRLASSSKFKHIMGADPMKLAPLGRLDLISQIDEVSLTLRLKRNACIKINQLPCELLSYIFLLAVTDSEDLDSLATIPLSHACRHWRNTALRCAQLWSNITSVASTNKDLTSFLLLRSRSALIDVEVMLDYLLHSPDDVRRIRSEAILDALPRTRTLILWTNLHDHIMQSQAAPNLQVLVINCVSGNMGIIADLFSQGLPQLKELRLRCPQHDILKALKIVPSHLTTLSITGTSKDGDTGVTSSSLLETLAGMKYLTTLTLGGTILPRPVPQSIGHVALPQLKTLVLQGETDEKRWFLRHIRLSSGTDVIVHDLCPDCEDEGETERILSDTVRMISGSSVESKLYTLFHLGSEPFKLRWGAYNPLDIRAGSSLPRPLGGQLSIIGDYVMFFRMRFFEWPDRHLWDFLPVTHTLILEGFGSNRSDWRGWSKTWTATFLHWTERHVETLIIHGWDPLGLKDFFLSQGSAAIRFPRLRHLVLRGLVSSDARAMETEGLQSDAIFEVLRRTLHDWVRERGPVERITFEECDKMTEEDVASLDIDSLLVKSVLR